MPAQMAQIRPSTSVWVTRGAGSGQHPASVLQEGRDIDAGCRVIWRISVILVLWPAMRMERLTTGDFISAPPKPPSLDRCTKTEARTRAEDVPRHDACDPRVVCGGGNGRRGTRVARRGPRATMSLGRSRPPRSASRRRLIVGLSFRPQRRILWAGNLRVRQIAGTAWWPDLLRGESFLARRSGIRRPQCKGWRDGGSRAIPVLQNVPARPPA